MSRTSRLSFIGVAAITMSLLAPSLASATHSWGGYHWARETNPFTLKLGDNVSSTWDPFLDTTAARWSVSTVLDTTVVRPGGSLSVKLCDATSGQVQVCNSKYGRNGWLGMASIWVSGKHITKGTVKVNDTYFNTTSYNTDPWRNMVMCQEVGHTLGLGHQDENFGTSSGSCMDYSNDPVPNQHPNTHDYDQLETIYNAHLDSTTTVSATAPGGSRGADSADWGELVSTSQGGHLSTFVKDLGAGELIIRYVIWA